MLASAWLLLFLREPRWALLPALGPALAPLGALGLLPLALLALRSPVRRALAAVAAVGLAGLAAGWMRMELPLGAGTTALGHGVAGSEDPGAVAGALLAAAREAPELLAAAGVLAAAAVALPYVRGPWHVTFLAAGLLAGLLLAVPTAPVLPVVGAAWITWAVCLATRRAT